MSFVEVKCPNCSGDIQIDDQKEFGYCVFCGTKVMYQETVELHKVKVEHYGKVEIEGLNTVDKLNNNGEAYMKLEVYEKAFEVFAQMTREYANDYRGWLGIARVALIWKNERYFKSLEYARKLSPENRIKDVRDIQKEWLEYINSEYVGLVNKKKALVDSINLLNEEKAEKKQIFKWGERERLKERLKECLSELDVIDIGMGQVKKQYEYIQGI